MKELPDEIYENINKMNSDSAKYLTPNDYAPSNYLRSDYTPNDYTPSELRADCKAYVKAVKAGRLMFIEKYASTSSTYIYIRSYEGTSKKGSYRSYDRMLITLGFDRVRKGISLPEDLNADILSKIYELGFIKEEKYKKLKEKQVYNFTY